MSRLLRATRARRFHRLPRRTRPGEPARRARHGPRRPAHRASALPRSTLSSTPASPPHAERHTSGHRAGRNVRQPEHCLGSAWWPSRPKTDQVEVHPSPGGARAGGGQPIGQAPGAARRTFMLSSLAFSRVPPALNRVQGRLDRYVAGPLPMRARKTTGSVPLKDDASGMMVRRPNWERSSSSGQMPRH